MTYFPSILPPEHYDDAYWFLFRGTQILVTLRDSKITIPIINKSIINTISLTKSNYLGKYDSFHCFCAEISDNSSYSQSLFLKELRALYGELDDELFTIANKAMQIVNWERTHKFCGQCGTVMQSSANEYAKICPSCGLTQYPRISPAIIVAIVKENQLLLARRFDSLIFSVIAGYVEPGENLEETVKREAMEEVGIKVRNIKYFASQPWAFSYSLMIAFTAEYESGEIIVDNKEIEEAHWFRTNLFPEKIPGPISIARKLIEWFKSTKSP